MSRETKQLLEEATTTGQRIRFARQNHPRKRFKQNAFAELVGETPQNYQAIELGRSEARAEKILANVSGLLGVPLEWFEARTYLNPYETSSYDLGGKDVDVRVHLATKSGKVILSMTSQVNHKLSADLAKNGTFGIRIPDTMNAPRLPAGNIVFFQPQAHYFDGDLVAAEHPTEKERDEAGKLQPVVYIGRYTVTDDAHWVLTFKNPKCQAMIGVAMTVKGKAVLRRIVHSPGWHTNEECADGLPENLPY